VLIHAGSAIETNWISDTTRMTFIGQVLATGLSLTFLIYAFGDISGAHFNPNVPLAFFLRREFPLVLLVLYSVHWRLFGCCHTIWTFWNFSGSYGSK
jgi:glycerol uptake facilitator-like aquaporin